jgi:hypothetical protein
MGKKLFDRNSKHLVVRDILRVNIGERLSLCDAIPEDLKDLIYNMMIRKVDLRFNSVQIKQHDFFKIMGNSASKGAVTKVFDPIATLKLKNDVTVVPSAGPRTATHTIHMKPEESTGPGEEQEEPRPHGAHKSTPRDRWGGGGGGGGEVMARNFSKYSSEARLRDRWAMAASNHNNNNAASDQGGQYYQ